MRLQVRLPNIHPDEYELPEQCPYEGCPAHTLKPHGQTGEAKTVRDTDHDEVKTHRYRCAACGRTFRVSPNGVSNLSRATG